MSWLIELWVGRDGDGKGALLVAASASASSGEVREGGRGEPPVKMLAGRISW